MKTKKHRVVVTMTFDKPVSKAAAMRAARGELVRDNYFASVMDQAKDRWGRMKVGAVSAEKPAA